MAKHERNDYRKIKPTINKNNKEVKKKIEILQEIIKEAHKTSHTKVHGEKNVTLYSDCIYRSHIDPQKIFGEDVSFCYGKFSDNLDHYKIVPFSEFAEGSFMFELTFLESADEILDYVEPIEHHPGAGRGRLLQDGVLISRIFYDPADFKGKNEEFDYIKFLQREQIAKFGPKAAITMVRINGDQLLENMRSDSTSSIELRSQHPNHVLRNENPQNNYSPRLFSSKDSVSHSSDHELAIDISTQLTLN